MRVSLVGSQPLLAHEISIERTGDGGLEFDADGLTFASPMDLAVTAAWGARSAYEGCATSFVMPGSDDLASYVERMDLVSHLRAVGVHIVGRQLHISRSDRTDVLIEVSQICSAEDISHFGQRCYRLVARHIGKAEAVATFEMVGELLENALEHSRCPSPTFAAAQVYAKSRRLEVGVADAGIGVREHLTGNPKYAALRTDATAIRWAFRPGVTGTACDRGDGLSNLVKIAARYGGVLNMRSGQGIGEIRVSRQYGTSTSFRATRFRGRGTWASLSALFP